MFFKFISWPVFIVSLAIGLLFVYIYGEDIKPIYIYPTPDNIEQLLYKDKADNCFEFKSTEIKCTDDAKNIPMQTTK